MKKKIIWQCPSNIALVKYWGKKENQVPCNASLSMTLQHAYSEVELTLYEKKTKGIELEYFFNHAKNESFGLRVRKYLEINAGYFPLLNDVAIHIHSSNSFPHSTGIASSASAFGAIALALLSASDYPEENFIQQASFLSRLGSGSACRSMYGGYAIWGRLPEVPTSSDDYAIQVTAIHENFSDIRDAILIVDDMPKKVSSSKGHSLMQGHQYAESRFRQANAHCTEMLKVLEKGDFEQFIKIIEQEALALHAMMMTSEDSYMLMKAGTLDAIESIRNYRRESGIPICFTLDAGPNVHVIYSSNDEEKVNAFLNSEMKVKSIIYDRIGKGPEKMSN